MTTQTHTSGVPYHRDGDKMVWVLDKGIFGTLTMTADPADSTVTIAGDVAVTIEELHAISAAWYRAGVHAKGTDPDV